MNIGYLFKENILTMGIKTFITNTVVILSLLFLQTACSQDTLQADRLNQAENYIGRAEQIITHSAGEKDNILAEENLGTAKAYLETLRDNKKFLTEQEERRRLELKQRADQLQKIIYQ